MEPTGPVPGEYHPECHPRVRGDGVNEFDRGGAYPRVRDAPPTGQRQGHQDPKKGREDDDPPPRPRYGLNGPEDRHGNQPDQTQEVPEEESEWTLKRSERCATDATSRRGAQPRRVPFPRRFRQATAPLDAEPRDA